MINRFGEPMIIVRTPSGGFHLYYRWNGERSTSLRKEGIAADIKASGGYVVAPSSIRPTGKHAGRRYEIVKGSWNDLPRLTPIKAGALPPKPPTPRLSPDRPLSRPGSPKGLHLTIVVPGASSDIGIRNNTLWREAMRMAPDCRGEAELFAAASRVNATFRPALDPAEVAKIVGSAWGYAIRLENRIGTRVHHASSNTTLAVTHPDAEGLLHVLRRAHGARIKHGETFAAAPRAMAKAGVIPEWGGSYRRYERAIRMLLELGLLRIVHPGRTTTRRRPQIYLRQRNTRDAAARRFQ